MGILRGGTTVGERWCPPTWKWATSRLCPPSTKHVLRGWYIVYGRYWYLCWADTSWLTIHLPLGRTCYYYGGTDTSAGRTQAYLWGDITLGRRYARLNDTQYLGWLVGATSYLGDTQLGWRYIWEWYTSSYDYLHGRYTNWSALHFIHRSFSYLGDTYLVLSCLQT